MVYLFVLFVSNVIFDVFDVCFDLVDMFVCMVVVFDVVCFGVFVVVFDDVDCENEVDFIVVVDKFM